MPRRYGHEETEFGYDDAQLAALRRADDAMALWPEPVFRFLATAGDERCRWKSNTAADPGHPNDFGHANMFSAVNVGALATPPVARAAAPPAESLWGYYGLGGAS